MKMIVAEGVTKRGLPRTAAHWVNGAAEPNYQPGKAVAAKAAAPIPQPIADLPPGMDALRDKNGTPFISSTDGARNYLVGAGGSRVPSFNLALFQRVLATAPRSYETEGRKVSISPSKRPQTAGNERPTLAPSAIRLATSLASATVPISARARPCSITARNSQVA